MILPALSPAEEPLVEEQTKLAALYGRLAREGESPALRQAIDEGEVRVTEEKRRFAAFLDAQPKDPLDERLDAAIAILEGHDGR